MARQVISSKSVVDSHRPCAVLGSLHPISGALAEIERKRQKRTFEHPAGGSTVSMASALQTTRQCIQRPHIAASCEFLPGARYSLRAQTSKGSVRAWASTVLGLPVTAFVGSTL